MGDARSGAGRDQDLRAFQAAHFVSALHLNFVVGKKSCLTRHDLNAFGIIEQALVLVRAVFLNDLVFLGDQFRPTDRHMHRRQARIARMGGIVDEVGGLDQVLGGQAPPIGSGTADRAKFGHDGAFAEFGSMERRGKGRRAAAQNDQIKLLLGCTHRVILSPSCRYVLERFEGCSCHRGSDSTGTQVEQAVSALRFGRFGSNRRKAPNASATTK